MNAVPIVIGTLLFLALAYRYYSAFLAAKVLTLSDSRPTPAQTMQDGHNYLPTNKIVLFGHHFAAISGAGPLIGPVLAAQFGYAPGLIWILLGALWLVFNPSKRGEKIVSLTPKREPVSVA